MKEKMILNVLILLCMQLGIDTKILMAQENQLQNTVQGVELPRTCYISTGDRDWKTGLPVDSKATIENVIEALATKFDVNRIFERGGQDIMFLSYYKPFEENRRLWQGYIQQLKLLRDEVGTSRMVIQAAHKRGMEVWLHTGLYAHGGPPDSRGEDLIRIKYPDCVPVNKYGTRRQDNLIEFCHSAAREALVRRYTRFLVENEYDGMIFYTYSEDLCLRYMDEFGYNQPIVEEFKRRYGKDILTEDFDKEAWARVRGDYVTLFLSELKESLVRHNKKLAVCIDPKHPYLPQTHGGPNNPHPTTGRIYLDWERWANQGIVDELAVAYTGSLEEKLRLMNEISDKVAGTGCRVSAWIENEPLKPEVTRIIHAYGPEFESGLSYKDRKGLRPTSTLSSSQILKGDDVIAKRRLLYLISQGKRTADFKDIIPAANDDDVFVRRRALEALVVTKNPKAIPIIEAALRDPEHSVRCRAAVLLGEFYGSMSLKKIFDATALAEKSPHFILHCAVPSLCKMAGLQMDEVVLRITDNNVMVRRTAIHVLQETGTPAFQKAKYALIQVLRNDPDPYNRELALEALTCYSTDTQVLDAILNALQDKDEVVQVNAAECLSRVLTAPESSKEVKEDALNVLIEFFRKYGDGCTRPDADWGWRRVGDAILTFGPEGKQELLAMMQQKKDVRLAELSWRIIYLPLRKTMGEFEISEEQDKEAHRLYPLFELFSN